MNIIDIKISDLNEDVKNYRVHGQKNIDSIKESLLQFNQYKPLIVQESTMTVLVGNARLKCMKELGWDFAKCILINVDDETANLLKISDNRTADLSSWDYEKLLKNIDSISKDKIKIIGFTKEELVEMKGFKKQTKKVKIVKVKCPYCNCEFEG